MDDNQSSNIIWNPSKIRILPHSLVMMCGVANSGKSTLAKKLFPEKNIISTDIILEKTSQELIDITQNFLGLTPQSEDWKFIVDNLGTIALLKNGIFVSQLITEASQKENDITILDSVSINYGSRLHTTLKFARYFKELYLFVVFPKISEVLSRKPKIPSSTQNAFEFYYAESSDICDDYLVLEAQIIARTIAHNVTKAFIITDTNNNIKISY